MLEELRATGFIGMWKDRKDIEDSTAFVQHLRKGEAEPWLER